MPFLAFGINHKTASVELREKVAFDGGQLAPALDSLRSQTPLAEAVLLSTCNRTEIYGYTDTEIAPETLFRWLADWHRVELTLLRQHGFCLAEQSAVAHLMRVAAGLDSMILGEPQILGQLKEAYAGALAHSTVQGRLGRLFETSFSVAKRVRSETAIGQNPVSVAAAAVRLARQLFDDFSDNTALIIGAGKTTELVARHLRQGGIRKLIIANRTLARAKELADAVQGQAALLEALPELLIEADIVISSTASPLPILGKGAVERALRRRRHRPIFMVDIAVPRDIEPQVAELSDVYLYCIDDLNSVIDENLKAREDAAAEAEQIIEHGCAQFLLQCRATGAADVLRRFRGHVEALQQQELERALKALQGGAEPEAVLRNLCRNLGNRLLHTPTVKVRESAEQGRDQAGQWLLDLFDVP
jgi:glutamyl-tRNA reductase